MVSTIGISACGGGGSSGDTVAPQIPVDDEGALPVNPTIPVVPTPQIPTVGVNNPVTENAILSPSGVPISLLQRLESIDSTINDGDFNWACNASRRDTPVGYIIGSGSNFAFTIGSWQDNVNVTTDTFSGSEDFRLTGGSENSIVLSYEDIGATEEITNIVFVSNTNWTAFSNTEGTLDCYVNPFTGTDTSNSITGRQSLATNSLAMLIDEAAKFSRDGNSSSVKGSDGSSGKLTN